MGEGLQPRDPLFDRRVRAENPHERPTPERVHDEEALGRRTAERDGPAPVCHFELLERAREGERLTNRLRPGVVRLVLTASGDGELDEERGDRGKDHTDEGDEDGDSVRIAIPRTSEHHVPTEPAGHEGNRSGQGCGDGHHEDIAVSDVGDFVGQDAAEFILGEHREDAFRDRHDRVLRIATGREGVRGLGRDDGHLGHRQVRLLRDLPDDPIQARGLRFRNKLRPVRPEDDTIGGEVGDDVHQDGETEEQEDSGHGAEPEASDDPAEDDEDERQEDEQAERPKVGSQGSTPLSPT